MLELAVRNGRSDLLHSVQAGRNGRSACHASPARRTRSADSSAASTRPQWRSPSTRARASRKTSSTSSQPSSGAIVEDRAPEALHVIYCDSRVEGVDTLTPFDLSLTLEPKGGRHRLSPPVSPPRRRRARARLPNAVGFPHLRRCGARAPPPPLAKSSTSETPKEALIKEPT